MIAPCKGLQNDAAQSAANQARNTRANPFSFTISVLGSVTYITQHTGPTALRPIPKGPAIMVKRLAQGHKCRYRESNPHSGFRTTPELESGARDPVATTLQTNFWITCISQIEPTQDLGLQCQFLQRHSNYYYETFFSIIKSLWAIQLYFCIPFWV